MKKKLFKVLAIILLLSLTVTPVLAQTPGEVMGPEDIVTPERPLPEMVPQEVLEAFAGGMPVEQFLASIKGPIPGALAKYADLPVTVIVQLEEPSLVEYMRQNPSVDQASYTRSLEAKQRAVASQISTGPAQLQAMDLSGRATAFYTKLLNGFRLSVPVSEVAAIRAMPGVKDVRPAKIYQQELAHSTVQIGASIVWTDPSMGYDGTGVTVAVIDSGIDYTHAMFTGNAAASAADYEANDPDVIETGSFPTAKVVGGWDFAGTAYDASSRNAAINTPVPDPDPLDEGGHGTHVASIIGGVFVDSVVDLGPGVAPGVTFYALKVFGKSGSTNLVVDALEWAVDPNGDGNMSDAVDVMNLSLGASFGANYPDDPELLAVEAAAEAGVLVSISSGNAGDNSYITSSPGLADSAITVAANATGFERLPYYEYTPSGGVISDPEPYTPAIDISGTSLTAEMVDVYEVSADEFLCSTDSVTANALTGKIALISRGGCSFEIKINNAKTLGAVAAIVYNNAAGTISMATGTATLPALSITAAQGQDLYMADQPVSITIYSAKETSEFPGSNPNLVSEFSSRGPRGFDSILKPDITAPGEGIFAASMGTGNYGTSMSGTSMAAPHIAGVAALLKEADPSLTPWQAKAKMMNTADVLGSANPAPIPLQGAGVVRADKTVTSNLIMYADKKLVSLNFGLVEIGPEVMYEETQTITIENVGPVPLTVFMDYEATSAAFSGASIQFSAPSVSVPAGGSGTVDATLTLTGVDIATAFSEMEEYFGYIYALDDAVGEFASIPFYFVPRPYSVLSQAAVPTSTIDVDQVYHVKVAQEGSAAADMWVHPVMMDSPNDPAIPDAFDVRYLGWNYAQPYGTGDIFTLAINTWAPIHVNQPYFNEIDVYADMDYDGSPEFLWFNYNYNSISGANYPNNDWMIFELDITEGVINIASPFNIFADYNSGFQEWYFHTDFSAMVPSLGITPKDRPFDYYVFPYDNMTSEEFFEGAGHYDPFSKPLSWSVMTETSGPTLKPFWETVEVVAAANDLDAWRSSGALGVMVVDYNGKPGVGQAHYWQMQVMAPIYLPIVNK